MDEAKLNVLAEAHRVAVADCKAARELHQLLSRQLEEAFQRQIACITRYRNAEAALLSYCRGEDDDGHDYGSVSSST